MHYTQTTPENCATGNFLFVGVVFQPYHLAFGISIGAKQAGEGAELSDNGNIRLCLPLEKNSDNRRGREDSLTLDDNCPILGSSGRGKPA